GRPNILDAISNQELHLIINTPSGKRSQYDDSYIRKAAIRNKIAYLTTMAAALASVTGIAAYMENGESQTRLKSLQEYHAEIK
ncbi:MAG: hypothetical protein ABRQ24_12030, partial [Syntrophomonadaceae bacterium]